MSEFGYAMKMIIEPAGQPVGKVEALEERLGADWKNLRKAKELSVTIRERLRTALKDLDSPDTSIVVSGSLARNEFTSGSDIDWTLLVDGSADPAHHDMLEEIRARIDPIEQKKPGQEGTFGAIGFSHELVHQIGGEDDRNSNTTRRLLLLLESCCVGRGDAYGRVFRNILSRYLLEDRGLWKGSTYRVPRFLQNDFARYWRTMAVDFAYKLRKRSGKGWAIRNLKLRMSRKLIYVSGLLACYRCHMDFSKDSAREIFADESRRVEVVDHMVGVFQQTPIEIVAGVLLEFPHLDPSSRKLLGAYDDFLGILADPSKRDELEGLPGTEGETSEIYQLARRLSHVFRDGLLEFFFDSESGLEELTKNYGVF